MDDTGGKVDEQPGRRRLVVLFVDLVESVRLMRQSEARVIDAWRGFVEAARSVLLPEHCGRFVKSHGDGMLVVFEQPLQAVQAALALHRLIEGCTPGPALRLRMGLHRAEIVVDDLDVYGTGVNLAARIAGVGRAGDTVVSAEMRDDLVDCLGAPLVDLGDCYLKHWDEPVRVFRIAPAESGDTQGGMAEAFFDDRPSLAIVPFATPEGPAAWGHAVAESIVTALSATRALRIVSLLSTRAFRHRQADPAHIRRTLGVAYVMTGSVVADGTLLYIDAKLCSTSDGQLRWAARLTATVRGIFGGEDSALDAIADEVSREVVRIELRRSRELPMCNLESYTLYLSGVYMMHRLARRDFERARELLDQLAERHPRSAAPLAMLSKWHLLQSVQGWAGDRARAGQAAHSFARRALDLDPDHALALSMEAIIVAQLHHDLDRARRLGESALGADPQESHAWLNLSGIHSYLGEGDEAERMAQRAIELSPVDPARFAFDAFLAEARLTARRFDAAVEAAQSSIQLNAMHASSHRILTMALALSGRFDEARAAGARLLRLHPQFSIGAYSSSYAGRDLPHMAERIDALRLAGIPG